MIDRPSRVLSVLLLCWLAAPAARAQAQEPKRLPIAALDIRGFYSGLGRDPVTVQDLGITAAELPSRALGGVAGLHLYLLRGSKITIGLGGEALLARARAQKAAEPPQPGDQGPAPLPGVVVQQRLRGVSGQLSLNFGHHSGWSYLTAGMGPLAFYSYTGDLRPAEAPPRINTLNMGGGARWFMKNHLAFCFDVRFYQTKPSNGTLFYPQRERKQLLILSAGLAFK